MEGEEAILESVARGGPASTSGRSHLRKRIAFAREEGAREWHRLGNAVVRGAAVGMCLKGGLNVLSWVLALLSPSRRRYLLASPFRTLFEQILETLRYTLFLASLSGTYVGADESIAVFFGRKRTARWRSFVAGLLAGPTLLLTGPKENHNSLALYILLRGITLLIRCGNKPTAPRAVRACLAPTRWEHGDTALMCLSLSQLGYSWILKPSTLPNAYVNFLNHHGGKELYKYKALRFKDLCTAKLVCAIIFISVIRCIFPMELAELNSQHLPPRKLCTLKWSPHKEFCDKTPCEFLHPGHNCGTSVFAFLPAAYLRAIPVYAPVYIIPALLVHRKNLFKGGAVEIWGKVGRGILRSSAFLATYCALAWGGACTGFAARGQLDPVGLSISCWTGGLATLIEKKSRRMELAVYCVSRAMEAWGLCMVDWGWVSTRFIPRRLDVILFSLATASILHCYSDDHGRHRDVFRSKYLNVLDFVLGNRGLETGTIQHVPSTQDLLAAQGIDPARIRRSMSQLAQSLTMEMDALKSNPNSSANLFSHFKFEHEDSVASESDDASKD